MVRMWGKVQGSYWACAPLPAIPTATQNGSGTKYRSIFVSGQ